MLVNLRFENGGQGALVCACPENSAMTLFPMFPRNGMKHVCHVHPKMAGRRSFLVLVWNRAAEFLHLEWPHPLAQSVPQATNCHPQARHALMSKDGLRIHEAEGPPAVAHFPAPANVWQSA